MATSSRFLTKSRFLLALEFPTKLFYTGKSEYVNNSVEESFLQTLAEGGYQVGALACLMQPGGVTIDDVNQADQVRRTSMLLEQDQVTIYEAAFEVEGLFARVDVLRKHGPSLGLHVTSDWNLRTFPSPFGPSDVGAKAWGYFWGYVCNPHWLPTLAISALA